MQVLRSHYDDTSEDAYVLNFRLFDEDDAVLLPFAPKNRISKFDAASEFDAA